MTFKVGDRVRRKEGAGSFNNVVIRGIYTVKSVNPLNFKEVTGYYSIDSFELVSTEKTDEELAAEWRESIANLRRIRALLKERGYKTQWKAPHRNQYTWKDHIYTELPDELRAVKSETVTEMVPVTKTIEKVL